VPLSRNIAVGLLSHDEEAEQLVLEREEVLEEPDHLVGGAPGLFLLVLEGLLEELRPRPPVEREDGDLEREAGRLDEDLPVVGPPVEGAPVLLRLVADLS
jgi:hypothetical protein